MQDTSLLLSNRLAHGLPTCLTMRPHIRIAGPCRSGFSLIEVSLALIVLGLLTLIGLPRVRGAMARHRLDRAAALVAADLEHAFAMAQAEGKPVQLACTCERGSYQVTDRSDGAVRLDRTLTADSNYAVEGLAFSSRVVDIFPSRIASSADTVTISAGGYTRRIIMTISGEVRILPEAEGAAPGWTPWISDAGNGTTAYVSSD
jgi:prepilin-type N-terminal cleavage/methylation domain-containing protein